MQAFKKHTGLVAVMDRASVDTDQIIPKQFLKRIERTGFGRYLFYDWRFLDDGSANPHFELNQEAVAGASVLVTRRTFGCGSSREHAVWALEDFGIRVLIAPSFADIFHNNCIKNGLLPIRLEEDTVEEIFQRFAKHPEYQLSIDLEAQQLSDQHGFLLDFDVDESHRRSLLEGLDDISLTLRHHDKIAAYEDAAGRSGDG